MIKHLYKTNKTQMSFQYTYEIGASLDPLTREVIAMVVKNPTVQLKTLLEGIGLTGDLATFVERRFSATFKGFNRNATFKSYKNKSYIGRVHEEEAMIELEEQKFIVDVYKELEIIKVNGEWIAMPENLRRFVSQYLQSVGGVKRLKNVSEGYPTVSPDQLDVEVTFEYQGIVKIGDAYIEVSEDVYKKVINQMKRISFNSQTIKEPEYTGGDFDCKVLTTNALKEIFAGDVLLNGWKNYAVDGLISISSNEETFKSNHLVVWNEIPLFYERTWKEDEMNNSPYKEKILDAVFKNNKLVDSLDNKLVLELINTYGNKNNTMINNIVNRKPSIFEDIEIANAINSIENKNAFNFFIKEEYVLRILQKLSSSLKIMFMAGLNKDSILEIEDQWVIKFLIENKLSESLSPKQINKYESWSIRQDDMLRKYFDIIEKITASGINEKLPELTTKEQNKLKINKQFKKWLERNIENPKGEAFKRVIQPAAITKARECLVITNKWLKYVSEKELVKEVTTEE